MKKSYVSVLITVFTFFIVSCGEDIPVCDAVDCTGGGSGGGEEPQNRTPEITSVKKSTEDLYKGDPVDFTIEATKDGDKLFYGAEICVKGTEDCFETDWSENNVVSWTPEDGGDYEATFFAKNSESEAHPFSMDISVKGNHPPRAYEPTMNTDEPVVGHEFRMNENGFDKEDPRENLKYKLQFIRIENDGTETVEQEKDWDTTNFLYLTPENYGNYKLRGFVRDTEGEEVSAERAVKVRKEPVTFTPYPSRPLDPMIDGEESVLMEIHLTGWSIAHIFDLFTIVEEMDGRTCTNFFATEGGFDFDHDVDIEELGDGVKRVVVTPHEQPFKLHPIMYRLHATCTDEGETKGKIKTTFYTRPFIYRDAMDNEYALDDYFYVQTGWTGHEKYEVKEVIYSMTLE